MASIKVTNLHGLFQADTNDVETIIARFLLGSPKGMSVIVDRMREIFNEYAPPGSNYDDVKTVNEFAVMLADIGWV